MTKTYYAESEWMNEKYANFKKFVADNKKGISEEFSNMLGNLEETDLDTFLGGINWLMLASWKDGKLESCLDNLSKHYGGGSLKECVPDKEVRDKFMEYMDLFCYCNNEDYNRYTSDPNNKNVISDVKEHLMKNAGN